MELSDRKTYPSRRLAHSSRNTQEVTTPSVSASVVGRASIRTQERKDLYISSDILKLVCEKDTPVSLSGSELGSETAVRYQRSGPREGKARLMSYVYLEHNIQKHTLDTYTR